MAAIAMLIGLYLALLTISLLYRRTCLKNLDIALRFSQHAATEGDEMQLIEVLTNAKWLPLPFVAVKFQISRHLRFPQDGDRISDENYRNDLYHILMQQRRTRRLPFVCTQRGYFPIRDLTLTGYDILMGKKHVQAFPCDEVLTVYPAPLDLPEIDALYNRLHGHFQSLRRINPDPFTFRGIREYAPHDPIKAVNFKASAKSQELMVNLWDFTVSRRVVLLFNLQAYSRDADVLLDEFAIRVVATLAQRLADADVPVSFYTNGIGVVSGTAMTLPEGCGVKQFNYIQEALAHINLDMPVTERFTSALMRMFAQHASEPEYWIVSTNHDQDLMEAVLQIESQGARVAWILPHSQGMFMNTHAFKLDARLQDRVFFV